MSFLNSLEYPVKITISSRQLNLDPYLSKIAASAAVQENELLKKQTYDYVEYLSELLDRGEIMKKDFYIVVPFGAGMGTKKVGIFDKISDVFSGNGDSIGAMNSRTTALLENRKGLMIRLGQVKAG